MSDFIGLVLLIALFAFMAILFDANRGQDTAWISPQGGYWEDSEEYNPVPFYSIPGIVDEEDWMSP